MNSFKLISHQKKEGIMDQLIIKITKAFEQANIHWGIGGSKLLSYYHMTDTVNDLDLLIDKKDIENALTILSTMGEQIVIPQKDEYLTEHFNRFTIDGIEIDVMCNFRIQHKNGVFEFPFNAGSPVIEGTVEGVKVPLTSLEAWYIAYLLMHNRDKKVEMIENYFKQSRNCDLTQLKVYLTEKLPLEVKNKIQELVMTLS